MAANPNVSLKVLQRCEITPIALPDSSAPLPLALTFFDILWYPLAPVQCVYFYALPSITTGDFLDHLFPNLKRSLSLALRRFYPLAGRLVRPAGSSLPLLRYLEGSDSVELTLAEIDDDFAVLTADTPKAASRLRNLVPSLSLPQLVDDKGSAVLALQVTLFPQIKDRPGTGVAIGMTTLHAALDGTCSVYFMKTWAAMCQGEADSLLLPDYDRSAVKRKTDIMAEALMAQLDGHNNRHLDGLSATSDIVRATFRLTKADIEKLRHRLSAAGSYPRFSSFSLSAGLTWTATLKARADTTRKDEEDCTDWLIFPCDLRSRFDPPVPDTYFGNLVGGCLVGGRRIDLIGADGLAAAAAVVQDASARLRDSEGVQQATELLLQGMHRIATKRPLSVAGSPRLRVYGVDFGWGKPCKVEVVSIDTTGAFSLAESRDEEDGGIEVGVVLPADEMVRFAEHFR